MSLTFAHPWVLWFLLIVPIMVVWYWLRYRKQHPALQSSTLALFDSQYKTLRQRLMPLPYILRCIAVAAIVIALARPQSKLSKQEMRVEGIDIVIAMDVSGSMLAEDFSPNRLEAAKKIAADFIEGRNSDRMGLVVFSAEAFTQVPLTIDHHVLLQQLGKLKSGMLKDGTAIGDGLATAINRIKNSEAKSKVIILLTDGMNNQGSVDPQNAAEIAALYGIRLYTIGVGKRGSAPYPFHDQFGRTIYQNIPVEIDENLLTQMATQTPDGQYFRATGKKSLKEIFNQIDKMEKSKVDVTQYAQTKDEYLPCLLIAAAALLLELLLSVVYFKM
ncbi:MAG: VWA domain-containing protein [Bacteroidales bacterium]|nr:VWA domain-containing protein [Candidatus Colimorpha onthohippi]